MNKNDKYKRHWSFIVTDKKYVYPFVLALSLLGIFLALWLNDPTWFSRFGNFIIGTGVWISMRYTLREGINIHKDLSKNMPTLPSGGKYQQLNSEFFNQIAYSIGDAKLQLHGFYLVIYGSLVGSFGDVALKQVIKLC